MTITAGIDAGSRAIKLVLWDADKREMLAFDSRDQGIAQESLAVELLDATLKRAGIERPQVGRIIATGYGRNLLDFADTTVTEITCHARGVRHLAPEVRTIIEIGGQDSKLIRLDASGGVRDFAMNDRCAAGTGRFLEMVAQRLSMPMAGLGDLARQSLKPAAISSMCVVFAETEIVGLLATGVPPSDIVAGIQAAVASRVSTMAGRRVDEPVFFTGGVALVPGMAEALQAVLQCPVLTVQTPLLTGALGAAILAGNHA
jgi:predicted CoA-substrate-specific enzyme activase